MFTVELPEPLQAEFVRTAHLLHNGDGLQQALIEAIELWLAQQHAQLAQAEAATNNQIFKTLRNELEHKYPNQWIVIAHGKFLGAANTLEELNELAPTANHRIVMQMGLARPREVELGWQMTFA
ncbi:MAG: hypothetical protein R3C14_10580 [Caldilineaceae bacterium]